MSSPDRTHLRAVERSIPLAERRKHVLGRLDPGDKLFHIRFGNVALEARDVGFLLEVEAEEGLVVLDLREACHRKQQLRRHGGADHQVEVREHRHLPFVLREHRACHPFLANLAHCDGRDLALHELELQKADEPEFAHGAREVFPGEMLVRLENAAGGVHHPEQVCSLAHAARFGNATQ